MASRDVLTSDVLNYLVMRYLQENGFSHTAFVFGHESDVTRTAVDPNNVPPGSLITFIQKGLQYLELEANLDAGDGISEGDFKMLAPEELLVHDIDQLQQLVRERKDEDRDKRRDKKDGRERDKGKAGGAAAVAPAAAAPSAPPTAMDTDDLEVPAASVLTLNGHDSEVYVVAWSPNEPLLASGSGDSTARIWNLGPGPNSNKSTVLSHENVKASKDVTTLDWNPDGALVATGSYDGLARIWSKDGKLKQTLNRHTGPIFALKWNKKGDALLSGSVDKTAIVWDAKSGEPRQIFEFHTAPTLDVDWRNNTSFASCSSDKLIHVCKLGESSPIKTFQGHADEVNAIKWDPSGRLLASCSDDKTVKIWSLASDKPVQDFRDHEREIYTIRWSPTGSGSANPGMPLLLASASFDKTVRLWDAEAGKCVHNLQKHTEPVYSVAFSPNGRFVATGSFDHNLHVWSVNDGSLVKTFRGEAGMYEVCWNRDGDKVAACFANQTVCVVDLRL